MVGLSGESQNFDGNGIVHALPGRRRRAAASPPDRSASAAERCSATRTAKPLGTRPAPGREAAVQPNVAVLQEPAARTSNDAPIGSRAVKTPIQKHLRDFLAIIFLSSSASGVAGYILSNERFYLPAGCRSSAPTSTRSTPSSRPRQAVVPGPGPDGEHRGRQVGDVGSVNLQNGVAVVTMNIKKKYAPIYQRRHVLLRPKTGLKDMYLALDPGTKTAGALPEGGTIPVANTLPDVNLDEVLSSLDARHARLPADPAQRGRRGVHEHGDERPAAPRGPARDVQALRADRHVPRADHEPARAAPPEHQPRDPQLPAAHRRAGEHGQPARRSSSTPSNANFQALAEQDAEAARRRSRCCPARSRQPTTTLHKADDARPRCSARRSRRCGRSRAALGAGARRTRARSCETTTPVIQNQLRPFARDVQPDRARAALAARRPRRVTPRLTSTFNVSTRCFNSWPTTRPAREEGFLFWVAWLNHAGATMFSTQDAARPDPARASCHDRLQRASASLEQIVQRRTRSSARSWPAAEPAAASSEVCPQPPAPGRLIR